MPTSPPTAAPPAADPVPTPFAAFALSACNLVVVFASGLGSEARLSATAFEVELAAGALGGSADCRCKATGVDSVCRLCFGPTTSTATITIATDAATAAH